MDSSANMKYQASGDATRALGAIAQAPRTQYEQLCERVSKALAHLDMEVSSLQGTLSALLPGEAIGESTKRGGSISEVRPPEHGSALMGFMRHIEDELGSLQQRLEYIRVRTPF